MPEDTQKLIEAYIQQGKAEGWTDDTVRTYTERLGYLQEHIGNQRLADVEPRDIERLMADLRRRGWKRSSRKTVAVTLKGFFGWLMGQGRLLNNPCRTLKVARDEDEELPPPPLSQGEVAEFLDGLPRRHVHDLRHRALLELLYGCGLRLSEALALSLIDIDLSEKTVHVRKGKQGKERILPLGRGAAAAVKDYLALRRSLLRGPDSGVLLLSRNGRCLKKQQVWAWFGRLNKSRGKKAPRLHPHLFRHSAAVHMLQNGADVRHVQQFLGHAELDTTKIYLRLVPGRLKEDYEKAMPMIAVEAS